jgi:hypothetical protein
MAAGMFFQIGFKLLAPIAVLVAPLLCNPPASARGDK